MSVRRHKAHAICRRTATVLLRTATVLLRTATVILRTATVLLLSSPDYQFQFVEGASHHRDTTLSVHQSQLE